MILPEIDPVAIQLGPLAIRWYSLSWLAAFGLIFFLANKNLSKFSKEQLSNLMFYGLLGAIIGGRVGYMIFYGSNQLLADPLSLFYVWQGGLSFHGGFLGVLVSAYFLSKHWQVKFFEIMDFIAPYIPIGLGSVRIGNFLNAELLGTPTNMPWGIMFPSDPEGLIRHPSQLYQAVGEGVVLLFFMLWFSRKPRPHMAVSSLFLIGYGVIRCFTEIFREPDAHIGFDLFGIISRGQLLSLPMIIIGIVLLFYSYKINLKKDETVS
tara:strand:- start:1042 stop:1833 length:792 start_codon:yes stop_codon:yes gene_type:complete